MKARIEQRARELGFDACRCTTAASVSSAGHFERWLRAGQHGEMAYLQRNAHKRIEPGQVLTGAKTIITLAASYHPPHPAADAGSADSQENDTATGLHSVGEIARYARYTDYHDVLGERLRQLTDYVNQLGGAETKSLWYVDTGPFLERDLAQRAGVGFVGKHTNLISRRLGNWFFLAEVITTLELAPDEAERNRCGNCSRCLAACPTQAITAPFQLDARRCISYLTIELKGSIPIELRPLIGNRIYGCDDCLAVCPWNRFAREGAMMKPYFRADLAAPNLVEFLALDEEAFKRQFAGTPILRARRRGFLRNVCVALGNCGDLQVLPNLQQAALDPEPLVAEHAQWAIAQIRSRNAGTEEKTQPSCSAST
jgi:epoxyqueuosine reductase